MHAVTSTVRSSLFCEYLRENEIICKTMLACLTRAYGSFHEFKKNAETNFVTLPFREASYQPIQVFNSKSA